MAAVAQRSLEVDEACQEHAPAAFRELVRLCCGEVRDVPPRRDPRIARSRFWQTDAGPRDHREVPSFGDKTLEEVREEIIREMAALGLVAEVPAAPAGVAGKSNGAGKR